MSAYTVIESRDPLESTGPEKTRKLAAELAEQGNDVTIFLVQNGVGCARRGVLDSEFESLKASGIRIYADEFALRERGIVENGMSAVVQSEGLETLLDQLTAGNKMLWN